MKEPAGGGKPPRKKLPLKAKVAIGVGCALVVAGVGCGVAFSMQQAPEAPDQPAAGQEAQASRLTFEAKCEGWDSEGSTPVLVHVSCDADSTDYWTAIPANEAKEIASGRAAGYVLEIVGPINADGSLYRASGVERADLSKGDKQISVELTKIEAADASQAEVKALVASCADAVKKGDSSLKGEAGRKLLEAAKANAAANPNMDDAAKAEAEAKADEAEASADEAPAESAGSSAASSSGSASGNSAGGSGSSSSGSGASAQAPASSGGSSSGSGGSSSGSSSSSSQPSQPAHVHNWVAVTSQQWHSNPVKVWVQDSAAWDETVNKGEKAVFSDGYVMINPSSSDIVAYKKANHVTCSMQPYYETVHHDATGHYETQDQGWYETVTTGYQCSGCGAWQ